MSLSDNLSLNSTARIWRRPVQNAAIIVAAGFLTFAPADMQKNIRGLASSFSSAIARRQRNQQNISAYASYEAMMQPR